MKKLFAILLAACMLAGLAACGSSEISSAVTAPTSASSTGGEAKHLNLYGIYKSESAYFVNEAASIEKTLGELGEQYGFTFTWHFNNADGDPEKALTLVDTAIADNADAIIICVPDQTMSQSVVDRCEAAGIPVIAVDDGLIDSEGNALAPWVGIAAYEIGYSAGEWMADYASTNNLLEDESVGLLYMTMDTVSSAVPRTEGEKDAWKDKLGDALSDRTYSADYLATQEDAYNNASAIITGHPEIKTWLVMVASESGALGAGSAIENAGLEDTSCVISLGCDELSIQWGDGNYSVIRSAAYFSGKVVGKMAATEVVEFLINGTEIPMEYATPAVIVDPDNYKDVVL